MSTWPVCCSIFMPMLTDIVRTVSMLADDERLMSVAQAAYFMGVSTRLIRRWIADGKIAAFRVRPIRQAPLLIRRADLIAWREQCRYVPGSVADAPWRGNGRYVKRRNS